MSKDLTRGNGISGFRKRQGPPRRSTVGANVTSEEKEGIDAALAQAGFRDEADGVRWVLFAFRDEASVRDAVARYKLRAA